MKFSECMRANGVPDFPDPTAAASEFRAGGDLNPNNPTFQNASKVCARKTGVGLPGRGAPPPGTIELNGGMLGRRQWLSCLPGGSRSWPRSWWPEGRWPRGWRWRPAGAVTAARAPQASAGSWVTTAAVVRTDLVNTVQVGGSVGYRGLVCGGGAVGDQHPAGRRRRSWR